jgi:hypothetical protein
MDILLYNHHNIKCMGHLVGTEVERPYLRKYALN